jgi:adenylyltransferase/sulfurtransferase
VTDTTSRTVWITDPDSDRYATLRLIDWWDQERLRESRVMVVGAGALGNEVVKNLVLLGVGRIWVVDFDNVEFSNLSRSVLFRAEDTGIAKAEAVAKRARQLNPEVEVFPLVGDISRDIGLGVVRRMDVVIACLDSREARMAVNRLCWRVGRPWVDGALHVLDGLVRVFSPPDGACYECTLTRRDYELMNVRYSCPPGDGLPGGRYPTTATAASIVAGMQVQEAIKLLHGLAVETGRVSYYSGQSMRVISMTYPVRADCPAHEPYAEIIELPYGADNVTVKELLDLTQGELLALDRQIITLRYCPRCRQEETVYRPYHSFAAHGACPECGEVRTFDLVSTLSANERNSNLVLSRIGIPPLDIVRVRSSRGEEYVELSGDAEALQLPAYARSLSARQSERGLIWE